MVLWLIDQRLLNSQVTRGILKVLLIHSGQNHLRVCCPSHGSHLFHLNLHLSSSLRLRKLGVCLVLYIDDLLVIASSQALCDQHVSLLIEAVIKFEFLLNEKNIITPSQSSLYLG